jgi:hypothetical protein
MHFFASSLEAEILVQDMEKKHVLKVQDGETSFNSTDAASSYETLVFLTTTSCKQSTIFTKPQNITSPRSSLHAGKIHG